MEDVGAIGGLWAALNQPWLFMLCMVFFLLLVIWLLPKMWRGIKKVFGFIGRLFGSGKTEILSGAQPAETIDTAPAGDAIENEIEKLKELLDKKLITPEEFQTRKDSLPDDLWGKRKICRITYP